jgi:hypothetical protein
VHFKFGPVRIHRILANLNKNAQPKEEKSRPTWHTCPCSFSPAPRRPFFSIPTLVSLPLLILPFPSSSSSATECARGCDICLPYRVACLVAIFGVDWFRRVRPHHGLLGGNSFIFLPCLFFLAGVGEIILGGLS